MKQGRVAWGSGSVQDADTLLAAAEKVQTANGTRRLKMSRNIEIVRLPTSLSRRQFL